MPANNLNVTLNNNYVPPRLDVHDHGGGNQEAIRANLARIQEAHESELSFWT